MPPMVEWPDEDLRNLRGQIVIPLDFVQEGKVVNENPYWYITVEREVLNLYNELQLLFTG